MNLQKHEAQIQEIRTEYAKELKHVNVPGHSQPFKNSSSERRHAYTCLRSLSHPFPVKASTERISKPIVQEHVAEIPKNQQEHARKPDSGRKGYVLKLHCTNPISTSATSVSTSWTNRNKPWAAAREKRSTLTSKISLRRREKCETSVRWQPRLLWTFPLKERPSCEGERHV